MVTIVEWFMTCVMTNTADLGILHDYTCYTHHGHCGKSVLLVSTPDHQGLNPRPRDLVLGTLPRSWEPLPEIGEEISGQEKLWRIL